MIITRRKAIISGAAALAAYKGLGQYKPSGAVFPTTGSAANPVFVHASAVAFQASGNASQSLSNTAGNLYLAIVQVAQNGNPTMSVSDTQSNTWHAIPGQPFDGVHVSFEESLSLFYCLSCAGGANTVTTSGSTTNTTLALLEYSGAGGGGWTLNQSAGGGAFATHLTVGPITTTIPHTLLVGVGASCAIAGPTLAISTGGYTSRIVPTGTCGASICMAENIVTSTGSYSVDASDTNAIVVSTIIAAFG